MTTTRSFCLKNNSARDIMPESVTPWGVTVPIPPFKSKDEYRDWCKKPSTDYVFFSLVEAVTGSLRSGHGNDPYRIHGVVADYDCHDLSDNEVHCGIARIPAELPCFAWNRTFSRGVRIVWRFQSPVFYVSPSVFEKFIKRCVKELSLRNLLPGLDDHILMPELFYCSGNNWTVNPEAIIPDSLTSLWFGDAVRGDTDTHHGTEIPLEIVEAEVHKKFPGRWTGAFEENARGVRFWIPGADAKDAAIVKKTGMVAFTGNKVFTGWDEIFGKAFVDSYVEASLGKPKAEVYSDGKRYYRQALNSRWVDFDTTRARRMLQVDYGVSGRPRKGSEVSDLDVVLHYCDTYKRVAGCLPFPLNPDPVVGWSGTDYLNSAASVRPLAPATEPQEWGFNFPWISNFLAGLFVDERTLMYFLAWLSLWLKGVHSRNMTKGHAVFLAGPTGTGKSLLICQILAPLVGGGENAAKAFVDGRNFNSELFMKALWFVDDASPGQDRSKHDRFSVMVKACVANNTFPFAQKYGLELEVPFFGRFVCGLNDDPFSLGILPDTDQSLLDKIALLRTGDCPPDVDTDRKKNEDMIRRELPFFARWLVDWEVPEDMLDTRFGLGVCHDKDILSAARANTPSASAVEWVSLFREKYRGEMNTTDKRKLVEWSAEQLLCHMAEHEQFSTFAHQFTTKSNYFGKLLTQAARNGDIPWLERAQVGAGTARRTVYRIKL